MSSFEVFVVGPRYKHHSSRSGYENFVRYIGTYVRSPVASRTLARRLGVLPFVGDLGWRLDQLSSAIARRALYSPAILSFEAVAALHMLGRREAVYHVLYGDTDVCLLPHVSKLTGNMLCASFHEPVPNLEWLRLEGIVRRLDAVFLVADVQRRFFQALLPSDRVFVVPHGVDTAFFKPSRLPSATPVVITAGSKFRDFSVFAAAMHRVWTARPDVQLVAIGTRRPGDVNPHLALNDARVRFCDGIDDAGLLAAYQQASVAVLPLADATANNALLEAMACGLPIVATDVGGTREYLGRAGLYCAPRDEEDLAGKILRLLSHSELRFGLSAASRERALAFDYRNMAEMLRTAYMTVVERHRERRSHRAVAAR